MINFWCNVFRLSLCLLLMLLTGSASAVSDNSTDEALTLLSTEQEALIEQLKIEQGVASFIQNKYFSFLSKPIVSKGQLIVNQSDIIWQVEQPVFSKTAIINNDIWQFDGTYQKMASNGSIASLIKAIFTGEVDEKQWQLRFINTQCLQLKPKDAVLAQAIVSLDVCLSDLPNVRQVKVIDAQNNTTELIIDVNRETLSEEEIREFDLTS